MGATWNRAATLILAGLCASACATTAVPPELVDPAAHVRPLNRGADRVDVVPVPPRPVQSGVPCEVERHAALVNTEGARAAFAECLVDAGDTRRATSVVEAYLPGREDILGRSRVQTALRSRVTRIQATRRSETAVLGLANAHASGGESSPAAHEPPAMAALDETGLNALLETAPDDPWVWMALGQEYERQGRDAEAVDAYLLAKSLKAAL